MPKVLIDSVDSPLGAMAAELAATDPAVTAVAPLVAPAVDLAAAFDDDEVVDVILCAHGAGVDRDGSLRGGVDLDGARRTFEAIAEEWHAGRRVRHLVVVTSAMVYGAWPDNPVPLTEDAVLRPNPRCRFAMDLAELERIATEQVETCSGACLTLLRPPLTLGSDPDAVEWLERSLWSGPAFRTAGAEAPRQYLLLDDLARAIEHSRRAGLDGAFNVASEGWLSAQRQRELDGRLERTCVPRPLHEALVRLGWTLSALSTPPELIPFVREPWVVAGDRLRGTGWEASIDSAEAFVLATRPGVWASLTGRRRQEASLVGLAAALTAAGWAIVSAVRRRRRAAS